MVAFGKPTIEEWQADVLVDSLALSSDVPAGQLFPNDVRWSRTNSAAVSLVAPFRPAIFEIRDGDHPYRFSTWRRSDRNDRRLGHPICASPSAPPRCRILSHWDPSDRTLFWDRLPITLCFMAIL